MHGLYVMAIVCTAITCGTVAFCIVRLAHPEDRGWLCGLFLAAMPMCALAYYYVRLPLDGMLRALLGKTLPYFAIQTLEAPGTEEPAKFWLALLPFIRRRITRQNFVLAAICIGFGFGTGELWFIANLVAPTTPNLPWYQFSGFLTERLEVCFLHSAFTSLVLARLDRLPVGIGLAIFCHWLLNFPIFLFAWLGITGGIRALVLTLWTAVGFILSFVFLQMEYTGKSFKALVGTTVCPDCGQEYPRPIFSINLGTKALERCPFCKKWHKV